MRRPFEGLVALGALVLAACGPTTTLDDPGGASSSGDVADSGSTSNGSVPQPTTAATTSTPGTSSMTTTGADSGPPGGDGYEDDDGGTGCTFTCPPQPPPSTTGGGGGFCNLVDQNCPEGEKCMPWANDGGMIWNSIRCSPVADNPGQPGDPCTVEGSQWSGIDDCDVGMMCFGVDPKTNEGYCVSLCPGGGGAQCETAQECEIQPGDLGLPICVPSCDPTAPDCGEGEGCFPGGSSFTCQPAAKMRLAVGTPCADPNTCEAGSMCAFAGLDCGQAAGEGCCAQVCDIGQPDPCPDAQACLPWFGGAGAPQWAHVGYCEP
ncbi:MAG: hypothetical protein AAF799_13280 [Myxococcota bacterium]